MRRACVAGAALVGLLCMAALALAEGMDASTGKTGGASERTDSQPSRASTPNGDTTGSDAEATVYIPPSRGSAHTREGAGTRAPGRPPALEVLAPDHVGLTTRAEPVFVWFTSAPNPARVEFTLTDPAASAPLVERALAEGAEAGFHQVSLADLGVRLEEGHDYVWSVAFVPDPERRDRDVVATAMVRRVAASGALEQALRSGRPSYRTLARNGIWYDALADLCAEIAKRPDDDGLRRERAALLLQAGLDASAAADRAAASR